MNNKGFTLVELLVVIVIMGVIMGMSWPVITRIQENNEINKYNKYGEALVEAAKLYVDSYEEDIFYYEDDLTDEQRRMGQCTYITYSDLYDHLLIKDFNVNGVTCNSESTFVRVVRKKGKYSYDVFLGCGYKKDNNAQLTNASGDIFYTYPEENTLNYMNTTACSRLHENSGPPVAKVTYVYSCPYKYNSGPYVNLEWIAEDDDTESQEIMYCLSESATECSNWWSNDYYDHGYTSDSYTFKGRDYDGSTQTVYIHLRDLSGKTSATPVSVKIYKMCSSTTKYYRSYGSCSKRCGGGVQTNTYYLKDYYNSNKVTCSEDITEEEPCNTYSCCDYVYSDCEYFNPINNDNIGNFDKPICNGACGNPIENQLVKAKCTYYSALEQDMFCGENVDTVKLAPCPGEAKECVEVEPPWPNVSNGDYWCNNRNWDAGVPTTCVAQRYPEYQKLSFSRNLYYHGDKYNEQNFIVYTQFVDNTTAEIYCEGKWQECANYRNIGDERKNVTVLLYARFEDGTRSPYLYINVVAPGSPADVSLVD